MRLCTMVYPVRVPYIYLSHNLEGEEMGRFSGFRGKYQRDDVVEGTSVARVFRELCGGELDINDPQALERVAIVNFFREDVQVAACHAFYVRNWRGDLRASEKREKPQGFPFWDLPLKKMNRKECDWLKKAVEGIRAEWNVYCDHNDRFVGCVWVRDLVHRPPRPSP
jgi:hypothetical protein